MPLTGARRAPVLCVLRDTMLNKLLQTVNERSSDANVLLDLGGRAVVAAIGLSYLIGLFVVNVHLASYSVRETQLLRVDYVLAGATWMLLFGLANVVFHIAPSEPKLSRLASVSLG